MADLSSFGYESEESVFHDTKVKDASGEVKAYDMDNVMRYPYLMFEAEETPIFKMQVLSNILIKPKVAQEDTPKGFYNVYFTWTNNGNTVHLGMINSDNMRVLLQGSLYSEFDRHLMLDSETRIEGDMMFAFCTNPLY